MKKTKNRIPNILRKKGKIEKVVQRAIRKNREKVVTIVVSSKEENNKEKIIDDICNEIVPILKKSIDKETPIRIRSNSEECALLICPDGIRMKMSKPFYLQLPVVKINSGIGNNGTVLSDEIQKGLLENQDFFMVAQRLFAQRFQETIEIEHLSAREIEQTLF